MHNWNVLIEKRSSHVANIFKYNILKNNCRYLEVISSILFCNKHSCIWNSLSIQHFKYNIYQLPFNWIILIQPSIRQLQLQKNLISLRLSSWNRAQMSGCHRAKENISNQIQVTRFKEVRLVDWGDGNSFHQSIFNNRKWY